MGVPCADDRRPGGDGLMSVPHPGGDPNARLYAQLKRDVVDRVPQITSVAFVPNRIEASQLHARFAPDRLTPPTGPDPPELEIVWYRQTPRDWFRVDYGDPNTGFHAGWHQDESHPDLGPAHVQYTADGETTRQTATFDHETPSLLLWEIIERLLSTVHPVHHPQ
jgi:hypothetical protein